MMIGFIREIYACPKCGSRNIECEAECVARLQADTCNSDLTVAYPALDTSIEPIEERRCRCMNCGHTGFLYMWKVEE